MDNDTFYMKIVLVEESPNDVRLITLDHMVN